MSRTASARWPSSSVTIAEAEPRVQRLHLGLERALPDRDDAHRHAVVGEHGARRANRFG